MNNLAQRLLTGTFFITAIISSIWWGPLPFQLLFFAAALGSLNEFYLLIQNEQNQPNKILGMLLGAVAYSLITATAFNYIELRYLILLAPFIALLFIAELYRKQSQPFSNIGNTLLGILYAVVPFALLHLISAHQGTYDRGILLGYFFLVWSSDSFAYVFGNFFGKHRLFERISPKKSWEGVIGGGACTLGVGYLLSLYNPQIAVFDWLVIALLIVITGVLGDLVESLLKRSLGVKDSGNILPGHGGLLDRFDALFLSVPFIWAYLECFVNK